MKKIDLEAHFYFPELLDYFATRTDYPIYDRENKALHRTADFTLKNVYRMTHLEESIEERLKMMDETGVEMEILSVSSGIDNLPIDEQIVWAKKANDYIYAAMQKYPGRFQGWAFLPVGDIDEAIKELDRCMTELGFVGWLCDSNFGDSYVDDDKYFPILECLAKHNGSLYIHPTTPIMDRFKGLGPELAAAPFGFGMDVSIDVMRLICKGVFDKLPNLKVFMGHMGEVFPYILKRMNEKTRNYHSIAPAQNKELPEYYFKHNIYCTTSGSYCHSALKCCVDVFGLDHVMFGSDYPYETPEDIEEFFGDVEMSQNRLEQLLTGNAKEMFFK